MNYCIEKAGPNDLEAILKVMEFWNMHHVPSAEMPEIDLSCFYIAKIEGNIIGAAGYKILSNTEGKTTLLGVHPEISGLGIGKALQLERLKAMHQKRIKTVTTHADRVDTILWYKKHYNYKEVGRLEKLHSFGLENIKHWTTLKMDLDDFFSSYEQREKDRFEYMHQNDAYPLKPYPPLMINVCLTGMVPTKNSNPNVPISTDEIICDAISVYDAGARIVHIHARDENGKPTPDAKTYETILTAIRKERPELICCVTTSGRGWSEFEKRSEVLHLEGKAKPDMASLTLGSLNFITGASTNSIEMIEQLAIKMKEKNIKPELEVFDIGMVNLAKYLERNQLISGRKYFNLLLGNINTAPATIGELSNLSEALPTDSIWAAAGLGVFQLAMNTSAIIAGGHVRVGLEDALYLDTQKTALATNLSLVQRVVRLAQELQRPLATPAETRKMLGL